jgi:hypothetical protein
VKLRVVSSGVTESITQLVTVAVAEAGDSSGTRRKGNVRCLKPLGKTEKTFMYAVVTVIFEMCNSVRLL